MSKYKNYIIIIILLAVFLTVLTIFNKDNSNISVEKEKYYIETDYSKFFTVNSCIYRFVDYLSVKDTDSLLEILDHEYKVQNNIDKNNIYDFVPDLNGMYSFSSKEMYRIEKDDYAKYYVFGYLIKDSISGNSSREKNYYVVNLDKKNMTFSIRGISENEYLEVQDD